MSMVNTAPGKISVRNLNFYYGKFHALKNINWISPKTGDGVYRSVRLW